MNATLLNREFVARPRVERRLRDVVASTTLTLLHAPLGAGKTAAAAMAFADDPGVVWMDAQPWHRGAFIRAIVDAVREVRADFGRMTLGGMEAGASAQHVGTTFAEELTHIEEPLLLIVDNVHVFTGEPGFSRFVDAAVSAAPAAARILALGRSLPEITLSKSFSRGRATIVDSELLVCDDEEIRVFGRRFGRDLDDATVAAIAKSTEGWAAGVMLAMSAPRAFVPAASGPRGTAEAYLTKELLPSLAPDLVRFLEESSVFETLDLRVLETINAFVGVRAWITRLQRAGALLTEVRLERYRLHPLLRELAQRRLRKRRGEDGAHRRAAEAYARAGEIAAALFHAASAGDAETAGTFLRLYAEAAIATGHYDHVFALARRIDAGGADADARFYAEGLLEKVRGSSDAQTLFQRAAESAVMSGDAAIAFSARAQIVEHDLGHLLSVDRDALTELHRRAETLGVAAQATVAVLRGWAFAIAHDFSNALSCAEPLASTDVTLIRFNSGVLVAYAQTALGRIDAAQETLDALIRLLENDDRVVLQTLTLVWFARLALAWGRTSAAADAAAAAARLASALDLRAEEAALYVALAEIATHNGNVQQAVQYAERARRSAERAWYVADTHRVQAFAEIALARAAFLGHDNTIARDLALRAAAAPNIPTSQRAVALTEAAVYTLLCDVSASAAAIANARSAVAEATPVDAADAIAIAVSDDILAFLDAADSTAHERLLGACAPFATLLEQRRGLVTLEMAGVAVGNARRGTGSSVAFETALELLTRDGPRFEAYLARAYASRFIKSKRPPVPAVNLDLTPREFEIVSLLVDGLTNKEIAQRLILSPRTIETHVERVLGKLEVGSRSRAIAKALRLGLVSLESSVPAP